MFSALLFLLKYAAFFISAITNSQEFLKPFTKEEELPWLEKAASGDEEARKALVERNMRLVAYIAKKYASFERCEQEDLISIGAIGLIKAVHSFDYTKKTRLATYAVRCIENEILMSLRAEKKRQREVSLEEGVRSDEEGNVLTLSDFLTADGDVGEEAALNLNITQLYEYIQTELEPREREIICLRFGVGEKPLPQRVIAKRLGISRSYVSRIETKAVKKLAAAFRGKQAEPSEKER